MHINKNYIRCVSFSKKKKVTVVKKNYYMLACYPRQRSRIRKSIRNWPIQRLTYEIEMFNQFALSARLLNAGRDYCTTFARTQGAHPPRTPMFTNNKLCSVKQRLTVTHMLSNSKNQESPK